jgi:hypothetical protein
LIRSDCAAAVTTQLRINETAKLLIARLRSMAVRFRIGMFASPVFIGLVRPNPKFGSLEKRPI